MDLKASKSIKSSGKDGIYYALKFPGAWRLYAFPADEFGDLWHAHAWRRYAIDDLASAWAPKLNQPASQLKGELEPYWKGFPRGRIEKVSATEFTVLHGSDLAETGITQRGLLKAFELDGCQVNWADDPHEHRDPEHAAALSRLLTPNDPTTSTKVL